MKYIYYKDKMNGVLLLDKPKGISSNRALQKIKQIFNVKKAGYVGTLDPIATGMLPICFGEATKISQYLSNTDKRYHVNVLLGQRTDTYDANGRIINNRPVNFNHFKLKKVLQEFIGKIKQIPPMYSAIRYHSRRLYEYARKNMVVSRKERYIMIYKLNILSLKENKLELDIHCSKGTYIRTIIDDLGEKLGCGAHVTDLRRLQVGSCPISKMINIDDIINISSNFVLNNLLIPINRIISFLPEINLLNANYFKNGQPVVWSTKELSNYSGLVRVTEGKEKKFIGIAEINNIGLLIPRRLVSSNSVI